MERERGREGGAARSFFLVIDFETLRLCVCVSSKALFPHPFFCKIECLPACHGTPTHKAPLCERLLVCVCVVACG